MSTVQHAMMFIQHHVLLGPGAECFWSSDLVSESRCLQPQAGVANRTKTIGCPHTLKIRLLTLWLEELLWGALLGLLWVRLDEESTCLESVCVPRNKQGCT